MPGVSVQSIIDEYGAYYINAGQNENDLREAIYRSNDTAKYFLNILTSNTQERFGTAAMTRVLQPFQKDFTPLGDLLFNPNAIDLAHVKVDDYVFPDDVEKSWLGFLASDTTLDRTQWPLVRYMLEKHIFPKKDEDIELNEYYLGVQADPTAGVAGDASTSMDGIKKQINDFVNADLANLIAVGPPPSVDTDATFCNYVEGYFEQIPWKYRRKIDFLFMSEDNGLHYKKSKRIKYNTYYDADADLATLYNFPNVSVVGLPSMGTSAKMWTTLAQNRVRLLKRPNLGQTVQLQAFDRQVKVMSDWWEILSFIYPQLIFTNDQDLS